MTRTQNEKTGPDATPASDRVEAHANPKEGTSIVTHDLQVSNDSKASAPLLLRIEDAAQRLGIGRTLMYSLVMRGEVESVPVGRLRRIPAECLNEYVQRLRNNAGDDSSAA